MGRRTYEAPTREYTHKPHNLARQSTVRTHAVAAPSRPPSSSRPTVWSAVNSPDNTELCVVPCRDTPNKSYIVPCPYSKLLHRNRSLVVVLRVTDICHGCPRSFALRRIGIAGGARLQATHMHAMCARGRNVGRASSCIWCVLPAHMTRTHQMQVALKCWCRCTSATSSGSPSTRPA